MILQELPKIMQLPQSDQTIDNYAQCRGISHWLANLFSDAKVGGSSPGGGEIDLSSIYEPQAQNKFSNKRTIKVYIQLTLH